MSPTPEHISERPSPTASTATPGDDTRPVRRAPLVSVVIPCYNHAHFLGEAIESVLRQTYRPVEVIVVDDGSTDATPEVAARYSTVRYVRQENSGLSAARNTGIRESKGKYLLFLDADDRLLPTALEAGVQHFRSHPECGFVFGSFRRIASDGSTLERAGAPPNASDPYRAMLRRNYISMHATVMYRREALTAVQGFDTSLAACEDYDLYLRMTRRFPVRAYGEEVAEYRQHSSNMSGDSELILTSALQALNAQWDHVKTSRRLKKAYREGVRFWIETYGREVLWPVAHLRMPDTPRQATQAAATLLRYVPRWFARQATMQLVQDAYHFVKPVLPAPVRRRLQARWPDLNRRFPPPVGRVRFGDLRRTTPIDPYFGYQRGLPVDRYYIERFLDRQAEDIRGRVLEIKDPAYTRRFGGDRVTRSDVLDVDEGNPDATIVADLAEGEAIPSAAYDCFILTQTLQLIYDVRAALETSYRILKPGGVLLASVPGITQIGQDNSWYWSFTAASAKRLFEEAFPSSNVTVEAFGNVLAAQAFLQGLAAEELRREELEEHDPAYPVSIVIRAEKPKTRL